MRVPKKNSDIELDQINLLAYVEGVIHHFITVEEEQQKLIIHRGME